jgi:hypothetical protein
LDNNLVYIDSSIAINGPAANVYYDVGRTSHDMGNTYQAFAKQIVSFGIKYPLYQLSWSSRRGQ